MVSCAGFSTFLPTIIKDLDTWTSAQVQLLTIPCYFLGAAAYMAVATVSDRMHKRGIFCVVFGLLSVIGYAILLSDSGTAVHYFACFLVAAGLYIVVGLPLAWVSSLPGLEVASGRHGTQVLSKIARVMSWQGYG